MFVYPSLFEGFGYPPLEAMSCGAPVIASAVTSLPEVCGDAAVYVDPARVESIAAAMQRLHEDDGHRQGLIRRGFLRAEKFRSNTVAAAAVKAYQSAIPAQRT